MGGQKAKKKPKKVEKPVTYSQFTKKPPAKLRENNVPIKKGKLVGDVQIAWATYSEDEKGKISTIWHVLKIDQEFAEKHMPGAKPGVIEAAMKAAAEGKSTKEIQDVLVKGIEVKKPKPLPYTYIDEKGRKILVLKVPKAKAKPLPYTYIDEKGQKILELKVPKKEKPEVAKKPEKKPVTKPEKKPKGASDIEEVLAKVKGAKGAKPESELEGIAGPGEEAEAADLGEKKGKQEKGAITPMEIPGIKEKKVTSKKGKTEEKGEETIKKTIKLTAISKEVQEKEDVKFKNISLKINLSNIGVNDLEGVVLDIRFNISEKELKSTGNALKKIVEHLTSQIMTQLKEKKIKSKYVVNMAYTFHLDREINKNIKQKIQAKKSK